MLEQTDALLTIAEVAVAFAGFASIVSIIGRPTDSRLPKVYRWPLRGMIACSLVVLFTALFPLLPDWFGRTNPDIWRMSGAFLAAASLLLIAGGYLDSKMVIDQKSMFSRIAWLTPLAVSILIGLLIAAGVLTTYLAAWYLSGILSLLLLAGLLFANIVMSQIAPRGE